jgi:Cdc6-like AAA superfamily ATPase
MFMSVYKAMYEDGLVAPPNSAWQRDCQYSYSMHLTHTHNVDIHRHRVEQEGVLKAAFEPAEELQGIDVEISKGIYDELDESEYPSSLNFLPPDTFREILEQEPPTTDEITVTFPMNPDVQRLQEMVTVDKFKLFMARPPRSSIPIENMTAMQRKAVQLGVDMNEKILYICGKAGCGKTEVALHISQQLEGRVQISCWSGMAATNLRCGTVHAMFKWPFDGYSDGKPTQMSAQKKSLLRDFYQDTEVFMIDEVNAMSAEMLAQLDETLTELFNETRTPKGGEVPPFGNKKMIFLGDSSQVKNSTSLYLHSSLHCYIGQSVSACTPIAVGRSSASKCACF